MPITIKAGGDLVVAKRKTRKRSYTVRKPARRKSSKRTLKTKKRRKTKRGKGRKRSPTKRKSKSKISKLPPYLSY